MTEKEMLAHLKRECSSIKSDLIQKSANIRLISEKESDKLNRIIGQLERWQNQ